MISMQEQQAKQKTLQEVYQIVFCTCPNQEIAVKLGSALVEAKLAACVNIIPGLTSIYTWQEKIETSTEVLLIIKTKTSLFQALETFILQNHPYECPEIVGIPISQGFSGYLQWIEKSVAV